MSGSLPEAPLQRGGQSQTRSAWEPGRRDSVPRNKPSLCGGQGQGKRGRPTGLSLLDNLRTLCLEAGAYDVPSKGIIRKRGKVMKSSQFQVSVEGAGYVWIPRQFFLFFLCGLYHKLESSTTSLITDLLSLSTRARSASA